MNSPTERNTRPPARAAFDDRRAYAAVEKSWFRRYRAATAVGAVSLLLGSVVVVLSGHEDLPTTRQIRELSIVNIAPPPPPPPPPPRPPEQKMIEQTKIDQPEFQDQKPLEEPRNEPIKNAKNDEPPGPLALDAKGKGPGDILGKPGGSPYGGSGGGGGGWGSYASMVQSQLRSALEAHKRTRKATMRGNIRLWADQSGRVIKVQLSGSTGDAELDAVLRNEVFSNLTLREPPPKGMPMPMIIRITEQRPS